MNHNYAPSHNTDEPRHEAEPYYHALFAFPEPQGRDRFGNSLDKRREVTDQSLADAAMAYRFAEDDVKAVIRPHRTGQRLEEEMSLLLRENESLRIDLGRHLLEKLGGMEQLPMRFSTSEMKNPNYVGYCRMTSHEYAAVLALSMLDGTYKASPHDPIESEWGQVIRGQHRWAAHMALGTERLATVKDVSR